MKITILCRLFQNGGSLARGLKIDQQHEALFSHSIEYIKKTAVNNFCFFYFIMPRVSFRDTVEKQTLNEIAVKIWRIN